jgi:Protein of unknown function (DUF1616)
MLARSLDLILVSGTAAATVALAFVGADSVPARMMLALPLLLLLPGYALCAAAFTGRWPGAVERATLSVGLSMAIAALGGYVLNWSAAGLQMGSWAILLGSITLGSSAVALLRRAADGRRRTPEDAQARMLGSAQTRMPSPVRRLPSAAAVGQGLVLSLAALVVVGSMGLAQTGALRESRSGFTQLWVLPSVEPDQRAVRLGLSSGELTAVTYQLHVEAGGARLAEWPGIDLNPGEQWEGQVELAAGQSDAGPVQAALYRTDAPDIVYRRVTLWPSGQKD